MAEKKQESSSNIEKFQKEFKTVTFDSEVTTDELVKLREEYEKTKNDISESTKKEIERFLESTAKTMITGGGFEIRDPIKDAIFLKKNLKFNEATVKLIMKDYNENGGKGVVYSEDFDDKNVLFYAKGKWASGSSLLNRTGVIISHPESIGRVEKALKNELKGKQPEKLQVQESMSSAKKSPVIQEPMSSAKIVPPVVISTAPEDTEKAPAEEAVKPAVKPEKKSKSSDSHKKKTKTYEKKEKKIVENPSDGDTGAITGDRVIVRNADDSKTSCLLNKTDSVILNGETKKLKRGLYFGIQMEDGTVGYVHSKYIKLEKAPKIEVSGETIEQAKARLISSIEAAKGLEKQDKSDMEALKKAENELHSAIKEAEGASKTGTLEQIIAAQARLESAVAKRNEIIDKMKADGEKAKEKIDTTGSISSADLEKIEKGETVEVAKWKSTTADDRKYTSEDKKENEGPGVEFIKDGETGFFKKVEIYTNTFEIYKKSGKYILEMNGSGFFSDDTLPFEKMPTKSELDKAMNEMLKKKADKKFSQKLEIVR
ncbi:MAG: hypothetical protein PHS92_03135 [Candidatus Gracilibacteria bacterium]|nr:hypothetical protein [Candidatus Gracilibacteria bacterium]